jgi:hypothetical protein
MIEPQADLYMPFVATAPGAPVRPATRHDGLGLCANGPREGAPATWTADTLRLLRPGCYNNWWWHQAGAPNFFPQACDMVPDVQLTWDAMNRARQVRGIPWLLGNEPDLPGAKTNMDAVIRFSQQWAADVGGSWAGYGVVLGMPQAYNFLEEFIKRGGPVGDHWHIHIYSISVAQDWSWHWREWLQWMRRNKVERPTIVSETCGWDTKIDQRTIVDRIVQLLDAEPLLDAVLWYSAFDYWEAWPHADLRKRTGELTPLGAHFAAIQAVAV